MNKDIYENTELEIIFFHSQDVIVTSESSDVFELPEVED